MYCYFVTKRYKVYHLDLENSIILFCSTLFISFCDVLLYVVLFCIGMRSNIEFYCVFYHVAFVLCMSFCDVLLYVMVCFIEMRSIVLICCVFNYVAFVLCYFVLFSIEKFYFVLFYFILWYVVFYLLMVFYYTLFYIIL